MQWSKKRYNKVQNAVDFSKKNQLSTSSCTSCLLYTFEVLKLVILESSAMNVRVKLFYKESLGTGVFQRSAM